MGLALDEPKEDEQPIQVNGIRVLVAEIAKPFVDNATVDYVKEPYGEGFVITVSEASC